MLHDRQAVRQLLIAVQINYGLSDDVSNKHFTRHEQINARVNLFNRDYDLEIDLILCGKM